MSLDKQSSQLKQDIEKGKIQKAVRKTAIGKAKEYQAEKNRKLLEANLKNKPSNLEDGSDWESCEEDAPVVKLEELLGNMNIGEGQQDSEEEEEKNSDE